ncbi:MAG: NADP-dependent oxidoreductase [Candidatus Ornithospirochaeta sp.]|nr:NADP-dependent oxidoreductase [Candidatus Ornithospirochaeta sp.]
MKAAQIGKYSRNINALVRDIPMPGCGDDEILIRVRAASVNPVDLMDLRGEVRLIHDYRMPLTLGNECAGIVEKAGCSVSRFREGDRVYARMPIERLGAFAEYAAVPERDASLIPASLGFDAAAAVPLTGLTAYQAIEELGARPGETLFIPGGSGSFGQIAVPVAKAFGLNVIVSGNARSRETILGYGADRYIVYTEENYWERLSDIDYVIDTLGEREIDHELSILRRGGILLSLRAMPNGRFARKRGFPAYKRLLFSLAGAGLDRKARKQGKEYRFLFVRSDGSQLDRVGEIIEQRHIVPRIDPRVFDISGINEALELVDHGRINGKVIIRFS